MGLKLNYKRTALIGFAFFGICLLWQVYDSWCPPFITDIFARRMYNMSSAELKAGDPDKLLNVQWLVGIIMACDNLAALILLPIFGNLSDKTKTPIGKRMPYILTGTFVAAFCFPFIPLFFHNNNIVGMVIMMGLVLMFMMMYRNPAVSLMPDITPKPLRAKANGIINIMGYFGGAFATVLGLGSLAVSNYINAEDSARQLWVIEVPFLVASVLMVISALVLFFTVKENKLEVQMKDELEEGERQAAIATPVDDDKPMSKENRTMLLSILAAEFLWFMADNGIGTYITNYVIYYMQAKSSNAMFLTIIGGVASVVGFAIAGSLADKIGRKWTITTGLSITTVGILIMSFIGPRFGQVVGKNGELAFPIILFVVWAIKGFGMALVHNCSFPMVVELCSSKKIGKFTSFYYTASMAAQTVTPILLGLIFTKTLKWRALPVYACTLYAVACIVFTLLVKNIKANKVENVKGLEALGGDD